MKKQTSSTHGGSAQWYVSLFTGGKEEFEISGCCVERVQMEEGTREANERSRLLIAVTVVQWPIAYNCT